MRISHAILMGNPNQNRHKWCCKVTENHFHCSVFTPDVEFHAQHLLVQVDAVVDCTMLLNLLLMSQSAAEHC